jgi:hypothetical protein
MGFRDTVVYTLIYVLSGILGAVLTGAWVAFLISYGVPLLLAWLF